MIVILIASFLTIFIGIKFRKSDNLDSYLDRNQTTSIIGVFAVIIFFSHFFGYVDRDSLNTIDGLAAFTTSALGQLMVVPFLFFSGYGIFEQYKAKGDGYADKMPKNRLLKVYLMFIISWVLFLILSFVLKANYPFAQYAWSSIGITSIGNSNWYVVIIIVLYFSTYISIKVGGNQKVALVINLVLCLFLIFTLKKFPIDSCWWNTIPAYGFGLVYSYLKPSILKFYKKNKANRWVLFGISLGLTVLFGLLNAMYPCDLFYFLEVISFALIFACFLSLFVVGNKVVLTLGKYCFWIYILQRLPMRIFDNIPAVKQYLYVYFLLCLVSTAILAFAMEKLFNLIWNLLNRKKV